MLRLNTSIPPTPASKQSIYGLLGGDAGGFPNGRRVTDDVVAIELRAIAGVTYPLIDKTFTPDAAANAITDGLTPATPVPPRSASSLISGTPSTATTTRTRPRLPDRISLCAPARPPVHPALAGGAPALPDAVTTGRSSTRSAS